jgi:hypothetical protein
MSLGKYGPIDIFRVGNFSDMSGGQHQVTETTLQDIAASYDRDLHPAPIVIGHPHTDAPAFGWAERIYVENGTLKAMLEETAPEFVETVKAGRYKKVSVSLFMPGMDSNPKPGQVYLKHIGFLGAASPAVPGLKPVKFSDLSGGIVLEQDNPAFAEFATRDELARLRRQVREQEVEKLVAAGRVLPLFKDEVIAFASSLDDHETVSFAEGGAATTRKDWFLSYLARQPKVVSFGAMDIGPDPFTMGPKVQTGAIPDGYHMDRSNEALFFAAQELAREKAITFAQAVDLITARGK